jgi:hypothetical protein
MSRTSQLLTLGGAAALAITTVACGSSGATATAPSLVNTGVGATVSGVVNAAVAASASGVRAASASAGLRVSVDGVALSTTTDSDGRFTLSGVPTGTVTLHFEGPTVNARLALSGVVDGKVLTLTIQVTGSQATVVTRSDDDTSPMSSPSPSPSAGDDPSNHDPNEGNDDSGDHGGHGGSGY